MNFFESQDIAKRNTSRLIVLFTLALLSLIIVTNFLVMLILGFTGTEMTGMGAAGFMGIDWTVFFSVGVVVTVIVLIGSLYKIGTLSGGGARIAEMMNGRLLLSGTQDLNERRVLNVVEEMALASGTPVPPVYLMEEEGINAFAAGYSPSDAVIGITRGALETLNREQLQGVIAHEFSHILHGDMRINIRLIGVLHGIMVLGIIGHQLVRGGYLSRRSKDSGGIVFLGLGLLVIGFVGTFFGNLIKAAVSRQREFLADASAVQFTRNPGGIAGALMQIGRHSSHSYLANPNSAEISHALFEEASLTRLRGLYATHPPLTDRISAILPDWDGNYDLPPAAPEQVEEEPAEPQATAQDKAAAVLTGVTGVLITDAVINQVGSPDARHLQYADSLLRQIPASFLEAAREPSGARAVIYSLVLNDTEPARSEQLELLEHGADVGVFQELRRLLDTGDTVATEQRMALVEIAVASLRQLSRNQYQRFKDNFNALIALDRKIDLPEWSLQKIVFHHLAAVFEKGRTPKSGSKEFRNCQDACSLLLSLLAKVGSRQEISQQQAFQQGAEKLAMPLTLQTVESIDFDALNRALDELLALKPLQKPALLKACAACITADREVTTAEAELLRAVAATIDCPMPPLLADP